MPIVAISRSIHSRSGVRPAIRSGRRTFSSALRTGSRSESPLVVIGHSMGALMLEAAFLALLKGNPQSLVKQRAEPTTGTVEIRRAGQLVSFPDVMIALNSARGNATVTPSSARTAVSPAP